MLTKTEVKNCKIIIIFSVHARTEDRDYIFKNAVYDTLEKVHQTIPKHDAVIFMGGMNAKFGEDPSTPCTGKYTLYNISKYNLDRLCDFATRREFVTINAMFPLKNFHLLTRISPD
jgi:hypothetical protein